MRSKDWRSTMLLICVTIIGMTNFLVPIFNHDVKTDPLVTYGFMSIAASIIGYKGVSAFFGRLTSGDAKREDADS